jgi:hypothetical protein
MANEKNKEGVPQPQRRGEHSQRVPIERGTGHSPGGRVFEVNSGRPTRNPWQQQHQQPAATPETKTPAKK